LPVPPEPKARIALGLYREAVSVNSVPYEFLGYFKVINTRYDKGKTQQIPWINLTLPLLTDPAALKRLAELTSQCANVGEYLYYSGRCAVAHAWSDPVVDPDDPDDIMRLSSDMPVAKALAEYLIEHEYGLKWERSG
jgi:hypothetical protein